MYALSRPPLQDLLGGIAAKPSLSSPARGEVPLDQTSLTRSIASAASTITPAANAIV